MRTTELLARICAWTVIVVGALVGLGVLLTVDNHFGFGWAVAAFAAVLVPCVAVARLLSRYVRERTAVQHGRPRAPGEVRYCARCGMETRTADPTCTFCGGSRFVAAPPKRDRAVSR